MAALTVLCLLVLAGSPSRGDEGGYRLVANANNPISSLTREEASRLFLKKTSRWPDGRPAAPVDLAESLPVREAFSRHIHRKNVGAVKAYWQQMIFSGRAAPPPEVASEMEALALVRAHPGAIGYVSEDTPLDGVKAVSIVERPSDPTRDTAAAR